MSILNRGNKGKKPNKGIGFRTPYTFDSSIKNKEQIELPKEEKTEILPTQRRYKKQARKCNINVAVSAEEKRIWKRQAQQKRLTLSAFIRWKMNS